MPAPPAAAPAPHLLLHRTCLPTESIRATHPCSSPHLRTRAATPLPYIYRQRLRRALLLVWARLPPLPGSHRRLRSSASSAAPLAPAASRVPPWRTGRGPRATLQALHSPHPRPTRPQPPGPSASSRLTFPGTCTRPPPVRRPSAPLLPATLLVPTAPGNLASSVAARENQKLNGANSRLSLEAVPEPWRRRTHGPSSANLGPCPPPLPPRRPERPVSGLNGTAVPKGRPHCAPSVLGLRQRGRRPPLLEREI